MSRKYLTKKDVENDYVSEFLNICIRCAQAYYATHYERMKNSFNGVGICRECRDLEEGNR